MYKTALIIILLYNLFLVVLKKNYCKCRKTNNFLIIQVAIIVKRELIV